LFYLSFMTLFSSKRHEEFSLAYINGLMQLPQSFLSLRLTRMEHGTYCYRVTSFGHWDLNLEFRAMSARNALCHISTEHNVCISAEGVWIDLFTYYSMVKTELSARIHSPENAEFCI